jgi:hypothetical protein
MLKRTPTSEHPGSADIGDSDPGSTILELVSWEGGFGCDVDPGLPGGMEWREEERDVQLGRLLTFAAVERYG